MNKKDTQQNSGSAPEAVSDNSPPNDAAFKAVADQIYQYGLEEVVALLSDFFLDHTKDEWCYHDGDDFTRRAIALQWHLELTQLLGRMEQYEEKLDNVLTDVHE
jgi:hypothetical protein